MRIANIIIGLALIIACDPHPEPKPPDPLPEPPGDCESSACDCAGERLRALECKSKEGKPLWETPEGAPFAEVCRHALADGRDYHPECLQKITSCSDIECAYRGTCCR